MFFILFLKKLEILGKPLYNIGENPFRSFASNKVWRCTMAYNNSQLKHEVYQAKNAGKKHLTLKITEQQAEFLRRLGFKVVDYLYWIETRTWCNVNDVRGVLKELHFLRKGGKRSCVRRLNRKELALLDEYDVRYEVMKYRIYLK